jgi:hypothetical protein
VVWLDRRDLSDTGKIADLNGPGTKLAGWGRGANGRLAIDSAGSLLVPTAADPTGVFAGKTIVQVSRGLSHTLALTTEGKV